jgi:2-polyprenyl-6-methoxyphenol hydroxylase-like FAD-dependent oxidoreductase
MPLVTAFPRNVRHRIDYLAVFPMGNAWRGNLFTNCGHQDELVQAFRGSARDALLMGLPDLEAVLGPFTINGPVQMRINDLIAATDYRRDGIILIGDALRSSCPSTGTGISRLLLDIELLHLHHLPRWLAAGRANAAALSAFYDDPAKVAFERQAAHDAEYRRSVSIETGMRWQFHRRQLAVRERVRAWLGARAALPDGVTPALGSMRPASTTYAAAASAASGDRMAAHNT